MSRPAGSNGGMETVRLRRIQEPSHVERLLEAYVSRSGLLPNDAFQIRAQRALSPQLQRVVARATPKGHVWACWADSYHTWLFTCEMSLPLSRERGAPVLLVDQYDEAGELKDSGTWVSDQEGKWRRGGGACGCRLLPNTVPPVACPGDRGGRPPTGRRPLHADRLEVVDSIRAGTRPFGLDVEDLGATQIEEGAAEIAAVPVRFLRNLAGNLLGCGWAVREHDHARTLVPLRQPSIVVRRGGLAGLNVDRTAQSSRCEFLGRARVHEHRRVIVAQDMEESGEIGLHRVAERAPHRDPELIAGDVRTRIAGKDELLGGALALAAERTVAREDDFRVQPEVELHDPGD